MNISKIFMDLKFNKYGFDGEIVSLALVSGVGDDALYLENSDYTIAHNSGWLPGDTAVANRILVSATPTFSTDVESDYTPVTQFLSKINPWISQYPKIQIYTKDPLSWLFFVSLYGSIDDIPNNMEQIPMFLPSLMLSKGLDPNMNSHDSFPLHIVEENALYDALVYKEVFNKLLVTPQTIRRSCNGREHHQ